LIDLLHAWGLVEDNSKCILAETFLANYVLQNMKNNGGIFIPTNLSVGKRIMFHIDNSDFEKDSGVQTHVLVVVGFQETDNEDVNKFVIPEEFESKRSKTLSENNFGELKPCKKPLKCEF